MDRYQILYDRFINFEKAFFLLRNALHSTKDRQLSTLEKESAVQAFIYTVDEAWKVMGSYLIAHGYKLQELPRQIMRKAYEAKVIKNDKLWENCLDMQNKLSMKYDDAVLRDAFDKIQNHLVKLLADFHQRMFFLIRSLEK